MSVKIAGKDWKMENLATVGIFVPGAEATLAVVARIATLILVFVRLRIFVRYVSLFHVQDVRYADCIIAMGGVLPEGVATEVVVITQERIRFFQMWI